MLYVNTLSFLLLICASNAFQLHTNNPVRYIRDVRNLRMSTKTDEINSWISKQGIKKDEIKVSVVEKNGYMYSKANANIKKGDLLFSLPMGVTLDMPKAITKFGKITQKLRTGSSGMLALLLLSEKALGEASNYHLYIKNLPEKAPGILSWSDENIKELSLSTTRNVMSQINAVTSDFEEVISIMKTTHLDLTVQTLDEFKWAMGIVKAKSVLIDNQLMLIPGMDSIGFDPLSTSEPYSSSAGIFGGKVVKVVAERSYGQDEEVVISYGLKSSSECLEDHGMVPDIDMEEACCEITLNIDGTERYSDDKLDILERSSLGGAVRFDLEADEESEMDPGLLQFLRLKLLEGKDSFILEGCFSDTVFNTLAQPFSKLNEVKALQYLLDQTQQLYDQINSVSNDENDSNLVDQIDRNDNNLINPKYIMARLRLQERSVLTTTLNRLRIELMGMQGPDNREYYQERRLREMNLLRPLDDDEVMVDGERQPLESDDY